MSCPEFPQKTMGTEVPRCSSSDNQNKNEETLRTQQPEDTRKSVNEWSTLKYLVGSKSTDSTHPVCTSFAESNVTAQTTTNESKPNNPYTEQKVEKHRKDGSQKRSLDDFQSSPKRSRDSSRQNSDEKSGGSLIHTTNDSKEVGLQKSEKREHSVDSNKPQGASVFTRISPCSTSSTPSTASNRNSRKDGSQKRSLDDSDNDDFQSPPKRSRDSSRQNSDEKSVGSLIHTTNDSKGVGLQKSEKREHSVDSNKPQGASVFTRISPCSTSSTLSTASNRNSRRSYSCSSRSHEQKLGDASSKRTHSLTRQYEQPLFYCYGDSFIGTLTLFDQRKLKVIKFKGASAKMQTKGDNALGSEEFGKRVFHEYTSFIENKLLGRMTKTTNEKREGYIEKILICSVIMPVVEDEFLNTSVTSYTAGDKTANDNSETTIVSVDELLQKGKGCDMKSRRRMVLEYNTCISKWCADLRSQRKNVLYVDINQYITEQPTNAVKKEFRDLNPVNIHILWEPTILFWLKEIRNHGFSVSERDITVDLKQNLDLYLDDKRQQMKKFSDARTAKNGN